MLGSGEVGWVVVGCCRKDSYSLLVVMDREKCRFGDLSLFLSLSPPLSLPLSFLPSYLVLEGEMGKGDEGWKKKPQSSKDQLQVVATVQFFF